MKLVCSFCLNVLNNSEAHIQQESPFGGLHRTVENKILAHSNKKWSFGPNWRPLPESWRIKNKIHYFLRLNYIKL